MAQWQGPCYITFVVTDVDTDELYKIAKLTIERMYKTNLKKASM